VGSTKLGSVLSQSALLALVTMIPRAKAQRCRLRADRILRLALTMTNQQRNRLCHGLGDRKRDGCGRSRSHSSVGMPEIPQRTRGDQHQTSQVGSHAFMAVVEETPGGLTIYSCQGHQGGCWELSRHLRSSPKIDLLWQLVYHIAGRTRK
jgi:hypothetical protein